jgi:hypothetical protein
VNTLRPQEFRSRAPDAARTTGHDCDAGNVARGRLHPGTLAGVNQATLRCDATTGNTPSPIRYSRPIEPDADGGVSYMPWFVPAPAPVIRRLHRTPESDAAPIQGEAASFGRRHPFWGVTRHATPRTLIAGITVWAVLVPESLAYATIAGVPPIVGLYAAAAHESASPIQIYRTIDEAVAAAAAARTPRPRTTSSTDEVIQ